MGYKTENAVIMAAGMSSRFAPLSYEKPKALMEVKGEILIERQIRQLKEAGIRDIVVVTGYQKEKFSYLRDKFGVILAENPEYEIRNNHSSIYAARKYLGNSYICSADNYFSVNPFEPEVEEGYYAAVYADGPTDEWCLETDEAGWITGVTIGGRDQWYMLGHVFWTESFSRKFLAILERDYESEAIRGKLWEAIYREHLDELKLKIRKYRSDEIYEFDSLDELRHFDARYREDSGSLVLRETAEELGCREGDLTDFLPLKENGEHVVGFSFQSPLGRYEYRYAEKKWERRE